MRGAKVQSLPLTQHKLSPITLSGLPHPNFKISTRNHSPFDVMVYAYCNNTNKMKYIRYLLYTFTRALDSESTRFEFDSHPQSLLI